MGLFSKNKSKTTTPKRSYRADFMDYESKGITPQRFGDTNWQIVPRTERLSKYDDMYHRNGLIRKIVRKPASDATRNGWRLIIPNDAKKQAEYQKRMDQLSLKTKFADELAYRFLHGDAYASIGIKPIQGKQNLYDPVDTSNIADIDFVNSFGQKHVKKIVDDSNPFSNNYGNESKLVITPPQNGESVDSTGSVTQSISNQNTIVIDHSRYFHITLDKLEDDLTGNSIIERCWDPIKVMDTALYSTGKILFEYNLKVIKSDYIGQESGKSFDEDTRVLSENMSTKAVAFIAKDEDIQEISTNVSGIDSLYNFAWQMLCAETEIPKSILLGEQSGTLAGASQDVQNYYDRIKAIQEELLRPQLEYIVRLLMYSSNVAGGSEDPDSLDWHIVFNPLWSADDKTQSETFNNYANAINTLINGGVIGTDEAKTMLQGQNNNQVASMISKTDSYPEQLKNLFDSFSPAEIDKMQQTLNEAVKNGKEVNKTRDS